MLQMFCRCSADVLQDRPLPAAALRTPPGSAAPFSASALVWLHRVPLKRLFRATHASASGPQWPPLCQLSAARLQPFAACFLFFNRLGGVHQALMRSGNSRALTPPLSRWDQAAVYWLKLVQRRRDWTQTGC